MKNKSKKSKRYKYIIAFAIILIILISGIMIYKNLFADSGSNRFEGIENYKLTNDEINSVKEKLNELQNIDDINIYTNSKIIKIFVKLTDDVEFEQVKNISSQVLTSFKEENLNYYDVEIFVESLNENSQTYPKIGYKHKTNTEFVW